jgi:putative transposase
VVAGLTVAWSEQAFLRPRFPWLRHVFAKGGYAGDKLKATLGGRGHWTLEIIQLSDTLKEFETWPRSIGRRADIHMVGAMPQVGKDWERSMESSTAWTLITSIRFMTPHLARYCDFA